MLVKVAQDKTAFHFQEYLPSIVFPRRTPVLSLHTYDPKMVLIDEVTDTALPSMSTTDRCDVPLSSKYPKVVTLLTERAPQSFPSSLVTPISVMMVATMGVCIVVVE
jgi:hypothetical protein